jgi:hypothetical protein
MAYYNLEPFGDELALMDNHFASLQALIANVNRDPKQRHKAFEPDDFRLLGTREEKQKKSPQEVYSIFRTIAMLNK